MWIFAATRGTLEPRAQTKILTKSAAPLGWMLSIPTSILKVTPGISSGTYRMIQSLRYSLSLIVYREQGWTPPLVGYRTGVIFQYFLHQFEAWIEVRDQWRRSLIES